MGRICLRSLFKVFSWLVYFALVGIALSGCGGGSSAPPPPPPPTITSVTVSPGSTTLFAKATQQFTANVQGTGSFSSAVSWFVNDAQGGNATVGTISATGLYTAPSAVPNPAGITIKAQSVQDTSKSGAAAVTINPEKVQISISPSSGSVQLGATLQFTATVTGTANSAVFWSVNNFIGGQAGIGFVDQNGLYTAPVNLPPNTLTVSAVSQEDTTKSAAAVLTVLATAGGITVTVSPQGPNVVFDGSQSIQFTATVSGATNSAVTWSVDSSYAAVGQISSNGLFTPFAFGCENVPPTGVIRAVSSANSGAQGVAQVNLVPPAPGITGLLPEPADAEAVVQISGNFAEGATFTALYPGPNGTTIPGTIVSTSKTAISGPVPLGASSGSLSIQQSCVSAETGMQYPAQQSNSLPFHRLSRLRVRANRQVLTPGESTQMLAAFMGDPTPQAITWSAAFGTVSQSGVFTATESTWDKVTGCISGTQQCDFYVFSVVPARIEPTAPVVPTGGMLQLSEIPNTQSPTWTIEAGGGNLTSTGLYSAPTTIPDSGAIPISSGSAANAVAVVGGFPGMVNRIVDYPDISANSGGQTTIPENFAVDANRVYVVSHNLPTILTDGNYKWIDAYDASDPAHPVWTGAVEGLDPDLDFHSMLTFAGGGSLWRVTAPQITSQAGSATTNIAFYAASKGQPILTKFFTVPRWWVCSFQPGLLIGIPSSFTSTGQSLWQSPVTALVFDERSGTVIPSQIALPLPNPAVPVSILGIEITSTRIFLLFSQQQSDGSQPVFLSTYDFTPALLQTISAQPLPLQLPTESAIRVYGNTLFAGAGVYDISSGLPLFLGAVEGSQPVDMDGPLALTGPFPEGKYRFVDYSVPANPSVRSLLYNGDSTQGPARFVGNHAYLIGSGIQIQDLSAPGGPIPKPPLPGSGALAVIYDLLGVSSTLFAAEITDVGGFVTSFDLSQTPPQRTGSFPLSTNTNEIPFSLAISGHFLFVGTSTELLVLDISSPSAPTKVASLGLPTSSLALVGNTLYAGTTDNHLVVVNVTNPASPVVATSINLAGFPVTMQASGKLLFVAADTAGLLTFSIANPAAPAPLSQFRPSSAVEGVAIDGNLALLAAADGGFVIADITNPAAPVLAGQLPLDTLTCFADIDPADGSPGLVSISLNNGIAYLGSANFYGRVFGFDYRQPAHPRVVSAAFYGNAILESVFAFAFSGSNAFAAGDMFDDQVFEADVAQPRNFIRRMCFPPPFGSNVGTALPELKTTLSVPSGWNPKTRLTKGWHLHP